MSKTRITAEPGVPFIDVSREFDAPRDLIFRAHTDPELIVQWMGPGRFAMTVERWEVQHGGAWRYIQRDADGNEWGFHGEFDGAPGHISLGTVTFEEHNGRTVTHVHSVYQSVEDRDATLASGMADGMNAGYDRLDHLIARLTPVG